jgi:hypothetical protein
MWVCGDIDVNRGTIGRRLEVAPPTHKPNKRLKFECNKALMNVV